MRRRRRFRNNSTPNQNLDSFLDILTNTVGVLMFISLFVTLIAAESDVIVRTPLVSNSDKLPYFFEVRNNQVFYIDDNKVNQEIEKLFASLPECNEPEFPKFLTSRTTEIYKNQVQEYTNCIQRTRQEVSNFEIDTNNYVIRYIGDNFSSLIYQPKEFINGDSITDLKENESQFQQIMSDLDSKTYYIAFIVRPDSFRAFRVARTKAWEEGFDTGWEPYEQNSLLIFGSGGRAIGVQ